MITRCDQSIRNLDDFRLLLAAAFLPVLAFMCVAARACVPEIHTSANCIILALLVGHIFLLGCLAAQDVWLLSVMLASLMLKAAAVWQTVSSAQRGLSDALMYFDQGRSFAASSSGLLDVFDPQAVWGTDLIVSITACILKLTGPSFVAAMTVFALISFWGPYLYLLAYREIFPSADTRFGVLALFLWPSTLYWSSSIGKDALMLALLGLVTYSRAKLSRRRSIGQFSLLAAGVCGCFLVRPHIAALLTISLIASFVLAGRPSPGRKTRQRILGVVLMGAASVVAMFLLSQLLQISSFAQSQERLETSMQFNQMGGSGFGQSANPFMNVILAPLLLFRPFPWEIASLPSALASAEGVLLLVICYSRRKNLLAMLRHSEGHGFVLYACWFVSLNVLLLGIASSNFGLLARQRVMALPLVLLLLATPREQDTSLGRLGPDEQPI